MDTFSLYDLNEFIRQVVLLNFPEAIWLTAEISQVDFSKGTCYLNLVQKKEDSNTIIAHASGIIWATKLAQLKRKLGSIFNQVLQEGTEVKIQIRVDYNERFGMKFFVEDIDVSHTIGKFALERQLAAQELQKLKLLDKNAQILLPIVLQRIAVISSENAAGLQDYINQLRSNLHGYDFQNFLFPAAVQGANVQSDILRQLKHIAARKTEFDAVVIIRGGGSRLDLAAFDQLDLCKAVALFPLPILVGIGHETDESLLDLVAHQSLKTPTAVAEFLINHNMQFEGKIHYLFQEIRQLSKTQINEEESKIVQQVQYIKLASRQLLNKNQQILDFIKTDINRNTNFQLKSEFTKVNYFEQMINLLTPEATLNRGFSILYKDGIAIRHLKEIKAGDQIENHLANGVIKSIVK